MIIIDMNQISLASLMMYLNMNKTKEVDESIIEPLEENSIKTSQDNLENSSDEDKVQDK